MAIFGNFTEALDELITSERQAEFSPVVVQKLYDRLRADDYGIIIDGVRHGDLSVSLVQSAAYNAVPFVNGDSCDIGNCDVTPNYDAKQWEIVMAECRNSLCTRTAQRKFMALWGQYKAIRPDDSQYDFLVEQVSDLLTDLLFNSLVAKLFLADKGYSASTLSGTDGFISQWLLETGNIYDATSAVVDEDDVTGLEWYNILMAMKDQYESKPFRNSISEAQFIIDEVAARKIVTMLNTADRNNVYDCDCITADGMVQADRFKLEGLRIAGIPVKTIPYTDMVSQFPELMNGTALVNPIFAVLTPKSEVQIGTPNQNELEMNQSFYDPKDRVYYFDIGYQFGAMIPSNNFIIAQHGVVAPSA